MLVAGMALGSYAIEASDGHIGTVDTFLFDDTTWKIRWLVVDTRHWLAGRQVLVHPSAIGHPNHERRHLPVSLTKSQVEASPDILRHQPVTMQMQRRLYENLIDELKLTVTIVLVTQNLQQAARCADQVAFFYLGEMIEAGSAQQMFTEPRLPQTRNCVTGRFG